MEVPRYLEIRNLCNKDTYSFLHEMRASPVNFKIDQFFEYILAKRDIEYFEYSFSSKNLAGHYLRDELGKSIMINSSNNYDTKNIGRVHEVSHDTLHLNSDLSQSFNDGVENLYTGTEQIEIEANTAAMMYLIPDISLFMAVSDPKMNFEELIRLFNVPRWLLERRMVRFLQINCMMTFDDAGIVVCKYQGKSYYDRNSLFQEMIRIETFEKKIMGEFNTPSFFSQKTNKRSVFKQRKLFTI